MRNQLLKLFAGLLLFGLIKLPIEIQLEKDRKAEFYKGAQLNLGLWERLGHMGFVAALSGSRSVVADGMYLMGFVHWQQTEWGRVKLDFDAATALQPRCLLFWDQAAWHMAFNASVAAMDDKKQPRLAMRLKAQRDCFKLGEDFLLRGIANNPDQQMLYDRLGFLYREKFKDHCKSAVAYDQCAKLPKAPQYVHRFSAYELAQCPGHEREAYEKLRALYLVGEDERLPTLLRHLAELQQKLDIPLSERVYTPPPTPPPSHP